MKPNKQQYTDFIVQELSKGNVLYKDVYSVFSSKFQLTERTFNTYWKLANEAYKETQQAVKSSQEVQTIANEIDKLKKANLTKIDRILIAEGIAMGKAKRIEGQVIAPSPADQLKALDYLSKIEGDYAAQKTELSITKDIDGFIVDE